MDIKQIFTVFRRWLWLILLGVIVGAVGGYLFSSRQTPVYQASTKFVVMRAAQATYDYATYLDTQQLISTYTELLTTDRLVQKASDQLGFVVQVGQASASQIGDTQFVLLTVRDTDPDQAAAIANALVDLLITENEELQAVRYITAEQNLQNRIDQVQEQIAQLQAQIGAVAESTVQSQIAQVQAQIQDIQSQVIALESSIAAYDQITADELQRARYAEDQFNLTQLKTVLFSYQDIYTKLVVLGKPFDDSDNSNNQLDQLQTTLNLYQQIYISSINSLENIRLMRAQNMPNVVQISPAVVPTTPISPKPLQTALLAAAVGLVASAGIVFLIEYLDDTIKNPDDVKNLLNLPVIGLVAEVKQKTGKNGSEMMGTFVATQPRSPISEAFRALRTNLEFSSLDKPLHTILVTSSGASEGKTTVASNLAVILSQGKRKVLLMDCDLRRPTVHKQFAISNRLGLSDLIRSQLDLPSVIQTTASSSNLSIITSGSLPPNPAEFLASERFSSILQNLSSQFDMVILDTPPMVVADVQILSSRVDGILFVIHPGVTHTGVVRTVMDDLSRINARVLGVVLNRIPRNRDQYYGGYRYYSPYTVKNGIELHMEGAGTLMPEPEEDALVKDQPRP